MLLLLLFFFQEKEAEKWPFIYFEFWGCSKHSLPVPDKKRKKTETDEGVRRQKVGEQLKRTEGGVVDEQEKNLTEGVTGS